MGSGKGFLDITPKTQTIREKTMVNCIIEIQNSCWTKEFVEKMKRQAIDLEKISANQILDIELKKIKLNSKKTNPMFF